MRSACSRASLLVISLVDVSDIFYVFSARGRGRGSPWRQEGAGSGSGGCLRGILRGGAKYLFSGPKCPPSFGLGWIQEGLNGWVFCGGTYHWHWGQHYYMPFFCVFWGTIIGNNCTKLNSTTFLGEIVNVMQ